ncbi:hypothetical protein Hypma_006316 [Hypsizygus marmoreus]|uniref:DUF6534 domain-containing protein n=1 Tax=Hypsizygus marmoreus TaxID=39966 RepID=A0A369JWA5_HYPMA|nr:hypothetical protein Hypma_006316 [Hypsizygus marmoreus]
MAEETFDPTVGALEIGVMVALFLFGLVTVQTFAYYKKFPNDSWQMKTFVAAIWAMELGHNILACHSVYFVTVTKYGQPETLDRFPVSLIAAVVLSGLIGPATQAFFAYRVHRLSQQWIIPCLCWLLSFLRCLSLLAISVAAFTTDTIAHFKIKWWWLLASSLAISTAVDIIIAGSLCFYLWARRRTAFRGTKTMVDRLIMWSIQTGLLTSIATVTMLILFLSASNFAWLAVFFIISRLFSNSLMASLNARTSFRNMQNKVEFINADGNATGLSSTVFPQHRNTNITIEMTRSEEVVVDDDVAFAKTGTVSPIHRIDVVHFP